MVVREGVIHSDLGAHDFDSHVEQDVLEVLRVESLEASLHACCRDCSGALDRVQGLPLQLLPEALIPDDECVVQRRCRVHLPNGAVVQDAVRKLRVGRLVVRVQHPEL